MKVALIALLVLAGNAAAQNCDLGLQCLNDGGNKSCGSGCYCGEYGERFHRQFGCMPIPTPAPPTPAPATCGGDCTNDASACRSGCKCADIGGGLRACEAEYLPKKVDWRGTLVVESEWFDQGQCASDWAISYAETLAAQWFRSGRSHHATVQSLSAQQLMSCWPGPQGSPCDGPGGYDSFPDAMSNLTAWIKSALGGKVTTNASYPYNGANPQGVPCYTNDTKLPVGAIVDGWHNIPGGELALQQFVANRGPAQILVDGTQFEFWEAGQPPINQPCNQPDHAVLVVGYDETASPPYWIVKNSWGASWGDNGYVTIAMWTGSCCMGQISGSAMVNGGP